MINVEDVAYVRYGAPDLDVMEQFLTDFGMRTASRTPERLYMRGYGAQPFIHVTERAEKAGPLGFGMLAKNAGSLETLASEIGGRVIDNPEPGSGKVVVLTDPQGMRIDVVHGFSPAQSLPVRVPFQLNNIGAHPRLGGTQRLQPGPSHVMRLGHVVLKVESLEPSFTFYRDHFGFQLTDGYFAGEPDNKIAAFLRCGLGETYTDHHTVALIAGGSGFEHTAFEVLDWDDLMNGHFHLMSREYNHSWGVGRHIEGSQVFDYWRDPFGNKVEHWTDGDLVNDDYKGGFAQIGPNALSQWAPEMGPDFML